MKRTFLQLFAVLTLMLSFTSCYHEHDFAAKSPLGYIPIIFFFVCIVIMTGYALKETFKKR